MQDELEKYDNLLLKINENFSKLVEKIYTRENVSINQEVKETYFQPNNSNPEFLLLMRMSLNTSL